MRGFEDRRNSCSFLDGIRESYLESREGKHQVWINPIRQFAGSIGKY